MPKPHNFSSAAWMRLGTVESDHVIRYTDRLERLLEHNADQFPSLAVFLGNKGKDIALRQVFPKNSVQRRVRSHLTLNLRIDNTTKQNITSLADGPVLFADGDPQPHKLLEHDSFNQTSGLAVTVPWVKEYGDAAWATLLSLGIFPHADVICVFCEDCGGLDGAQDLLEAWADAAPTSQYHTLIKPHLILVHSDPQIDSSHIPADLLKPFSNCSIVTLGGSSKSSATRYASLRANLGQAILAARSRRTASRMLFSARHLETLILRSMKQFNLPTALPFNALQASRLDLPVSLDYGVHLINFMALAKHNRIPHEALRSFVASAILMDAYPPNMHIFDPKLLFSVLYRSCCLFACHKLFTNPESAKFFCQEIENHFVYMVQQMITEVRSSSQIRSAENHRWKHYWKLLESAVDCFSCLSAKPEHTLSCGQLLCDQCVGIFGQGITGGQHHYLVKYCPICSQANVNVIRLKPGTAGPRVLSVDGGGPRGVVPLESLKQLQSHIGPACVIQDFFDFAIGTSAGGLIVLGLFLKHLSVEKSSGIFKSLIRDIFRGQPQQKPNKISDHVKRVIKCAFYDGIYEVQDLEVALKALFGQEDLMIESTCHAKIAVTATADELPSARLFTNYNGPGSPHQEAGYRLERPRDMKHEVRSWQAARATAAAPIYFPPVEITGLGTFWDGAMSRHNNPVNLALWEARRLWPDIECPDVVVSLGTGMQQEKPLSPVQGAWSMVKRSVISKRCVPRLWSSMMGFLEGEETSRDLRNTLNATARGDYFRFNIILPGATPAIDNVECMDMLAEQAQSPSPGSASPIDTAIALLVSCFFFELNSTPSKQLSGMYHCKGIIRCRFPDAQELLNALIRLGGPHMLFYKDEKSLGCKLTEEDLCGTCQRYSRKIEFLASSLDDPLTLSLRWQNKSRNLSAMPHSISWFVKMQQLDMPFGCRNHGTPGALQCPSCSNDSSDVRGALWFSCDDFQRGKRSRIQSPILSEAPPKKTLKLDDAGQLARSKTIEQRQTIFTDI